jgi:NAD-dependent dihydropyrimidine dehydrogenase PreA subunit
MAYEIVKDVCEGESSCVDVCPVDCIKKGDGENGKGTTWFLIVAEDCVSCNACLEACPVEGAILPD